MLQVRGISGLHRVSLAVPPPCQCTEHEHETHLSAAVSSPDVVQAKESKVDLHAV